MGRLAVDNSTKGQGLGKLLLVDSMKKVQSASADVGVYALLVDAKDEAAKSFYKKYGFINGKTEGYNRLAKGLQYRAFGYRSFKNYRLRLLNA